MTSLSTMAKRPREGTAVDKDSHPKEDLKQTIRENILKPLGERLTDDSDLAYCFSAKPGYDTPLDYLENEDLPWKKTPILFYGSLMSPEWLELVAKLEDVPTLATGRVRGYKYKMWNGYPAALPEKGSVIVGKVFMCEDRETFTKLRIYHTSAYMHIDVAIELENGGELDPAIMWMWDGPLDDYCLQDGVFDLNHYINGNQILRDEIKRRMSG